jgi:general secretion pathway protein E
MHHIIEQLQSEGLLTNKESKAYKVGGELGWLASIGMTLSDFEERIVEAIRLGKLTLREIEVQSYLNSKAILKSVAKRFQTDVVELEYEKLDMQLIEHSGVDLLKRYHALPLEGRGDEVWVVCDDPLNLELKENFQRIFSHHSLKVVIALPSEIERQLYHLEKSESLKQLINAIRNDLERSQTLGETEESPAILKLIERILIHAIESDASDIHIEATEHSCQVRQRVDGVLQIAYIFDRDLFIPLSLRVKLLSNLDITEKRKPQDGRFSSSVNGKMYDFRVSTLPTTEGESIVLRILDTQKVLIALEDAGMSEENFTTFSRVIRVAHGIILVTGPTGSGKTTTLYGALNAIKDETEKMITVEDPVEYKMVGLQQVQVNQAIGLTFLEVLRSILRQDPDKIMIGEIRDKETLQTAIQAALTGHMVLSTLHTNDAISAIARMLDMGIEAYLLSGTVVAIQAQRLVRKVCLACREEISLSPTLYQELSHYLPLKYQFYKGKGCEECNFSGYRGREMISEILEVSETLSRLISERASRELLLKQAREEGFKTMFEDGLSKVLKGVSTIEELYRVTKLP